MRVYIILNFSSARVSKKVPVIQNSHLQLFKHPDRAQEWKHTMKRKKNAMHLRECELACPLVFLANTHWLTDANTTVCRIKSPLVQLRTSLTQSLPTRAEEAQKTCQLYLRSQWDTDALLFGLERTRRGSESEAVCILLGCVDVTETVFYVLDYMC